MAKNAFQKKQKIIKDQEKQIKQYEELLARNCVVSFTKLANLCIGKIIEI